jgi:hypothetical protein
VNRKKRLRGWRKHMTGSDIIKLIKDNGLEDYHIGVKHWEYSRPSGVELVSLDILGVGDVGHADKLAHFEVEEAD